uniref:Uncharacterized protein n=1 Tax=Mus musculus TaxID=10090 RepID=Q5U444_MOUSE|nr:Unknown (protein for MGC:103401) [Mus musculus]
MRAACLFLLFMPGLLAQGQYDLDPLPPFPDHVQYNHYGDQIDNADYYDYQEVSPRTQKSTHLCLLRAGIKGFHHHCLV